MGLPVMLLVRVMPYHEHQGPGIDPLLLQVHVSMRSIVGLHKSVPFVAISSA
jgi:hypothetical protein